MLEEFQVSCPGDGFHSSSRTELVEYVANVCLSRGGTDYQLGGYLLVGEPFRHKAQDLQFPR